MKLFQRILICLVLLGAFLPTARGQKVYQVALARWDANFNNGDGLSGSNNLGADLAWGESYILMSYMTMYRHTGVQVWLEKMFDHIAHVIDERDDNANRLNFLGNSTPTWSCNIYGNGDNYGWLVHSGMITYPMADLVQEVINDASLHNVTLPASNPVWGNMTYLQAANLLGTEVDATINHHAFQWDNSTNAYNDHVFNNVWNWWLPAGWNLTCGAYRFPGGSQIEDIIGEDLSYEILPLNMQNAMGRTLVARWEATNDPALLDQITRLANSTKRVLWHDGQGENIFSYWGYQGSEGDDVGHAAITFNFARLCFEAGIVFTAADMTRFASTLKNQVYVNPHLFKGFIDGTSNNTYADNSGDGSMGLFAWFAQFDRDLYHIVGEVWNQAALYNTASQSPTLWPFMANMAINNHLFTPAVYYDGYGNASDWADVDGGDIDGDGKEDIVSARNLDGRIYVDGLVTNAGFHSATLVGINDIQNHGTSPDWAGVAVGNFNTASAKREFAAISNQTGDLYLYSMYGTANTISQYASEVIYDNNPQWAGIAAGNFDGVAGDEIVGVRNLDGDFYLWQNPYSNQVIQLATYTNFGSASQWADIAAGDFDGDGKDEFVAVRNYDGGIEMLEYDPATQTIVGKAAYYGNGPDSEYTGITAGDFDQDGKDEFILHRNYDGDFFIYGLNAAGQIVSEGTERFPFNQNLGVLGTVNIGSPCCEELVSLRNFDGDIYVYAVGLGGCAMNAICEEEPVRNTRRKMAALPALEVRLYPSPATATATLDFQLDEAALVHAELYDLRGVKVRELANGKLAAGSHSLRLDRGGVAAGTYLVKMRIGANLITKKLVWQ